MFSVMYKSNVEKIYQYEKRRKVDQEMLVSYTSKTNHEQDIS